MSHCELKADPPLAAMAVCQRGSRLSVHTVLPLFPATPPSYAGPA